jgi:hypothetical protein
MPLCEPRIPADSSSASGFQLPDGVPRLHSFYLYLTSGCNLACRHCWVKPRFTNGRPEPLECIDPELLFTAVTEAKTLGLTSAKLTGGEPLFHPRFVDIVNGLSGLGIDMNMETNGVLITPELAVFLKNDTKIDFISVSLDDDEPESHDAFRGVEGAFDATLRGLDALREAGEFFSMQGERFLCCILPPSGPDDIASGAFRVSLAIAHMAQKRGGILVHGGLAEFRGEGIILAAPGATGKTTAFNRLPVPWHPLSDDAALIVRHADNRYFGHAWPTWSRFFFNGSGGSWKTEYGVPLKSLVFLSQSPENALEVLNTSPAAAMLIESVEQVNWVFNRRLTPARIH